MDITTLHNISLLKTPMKYYASYETIFMYILICHIRIFTYFPIIRGKVFMSKNTIWARFYTQHTTQQKFYVQWEKNNSSALPTHPDNSNLFFITKTEGSS
jgi:hypothetical protein